MKALSIKQPWASLIVHGIKDIENRTWKTNFRGRIYVHASKINFKDFDVLMSLPDRQRKVFNDFIKTNKFNSAIGSAIIGEVDIVDCVINHESIWAEKLLPYPDINDYRNDEGGNIELFKENVRLFKEQKLIYNWVLANPVLYEKPIPAKGKLSLWEPDFEIVECIGCSGKFNHEEMSQDDADENYCPECWSHFKPILKAEYDELKANGEID